jgi:FAD/FMN-containing dehydrogenase/Fe-S oxidoreductase
MDFSKYMNRILELDPKKRLARVQPGLIFDDLRHATEPHHLTFGSDTSTHHWCTLGGMIGNNSCGVHSVMAQFQTGGGRTSDNLHELDICTYDGARMRVGKTSDAELEQIIRAGGRRGEIYSRLRNLRDKYGDLVRKHYPNIPRRVSGYNLDDLLPERGFHVARALSGSEGTCVSVLEATMHLIYSPPVRVLLVLGYPDVYSSGDHVMEVLEYKPTGLEGVDDILVNDERQRKLNPDSLPMLPKGRGWLLVEFGGETKEEAADAARKLMAKLRRKPGGPEAKLFTEKEDQEKIWKIRESSLGATAHRGGREDAWEGWEDSAVPPEKLGDYLREFRSMLDRFGYGCTLYGHFGQGCVHTRINFGLKNADGIKKYREFVHEMSRIVIEFGGSLSGEHGDGQSRAEMLPIMFGKELVQAFAEFKGIWDPTNKMNPHKVVEPYRVDENLRYGSDYNPPQLETYFKFPDDKGSFSYAMERCVGVGKCRRMEGGTMCPSFMVTREEKDTTRGRARLFWEMLNGGTIGKNGWRDDAVADALDLCLACKGCKADCPVNVDMATYKAEFLAHYYKGRLRPRAAYSMGLIYWWARLASKMPKIVNYFTQNRPFSIVAKWMGGVAQERQMPKFATETFREWFKKNRREEVHSFATKKLETSRVGSCDKEKRVMLWVDTFTNFFHPEIPKAAVEVLEAAGFYVVIPKQMLCCGRPLYDFGMLATARKLLEDILLHLHCEIADGTPIVGLEPSCIAVFRDELKNMFPMHEDARRLGEKVFTLSEFLENYAKDFRIPQLERKAILHGHCHQKSVMKMHSEHEVYKKIGLDFNELESGCCGMAGSFGFEKEHYDISVKCGERVLLPAARKADDDTLIIADGFSCREQLTQLTDRKPMHTAEVLRLALREGVVKPRPIQRPKATPKPQFAETHSASRTQEKRFSAEPKHHSVAGLVGAAAGFITGIFSGIASVFSHSKEHH